MAYIGIKDVYIAKVIKNDTTGYEADTPVRLGKAASLKKDYKGSMEKNYYDDSLDSMLQGDTEKTLEVEVKELTQEVEAMINGQKLVKGMRVESTSDSVGDFAVGYRTKLQNGKYEFVWKYVCTPEPFGSNHDTVADKAKINNRTVKFTCRNREIDGVDGVNINESALLTGDTEAKALLAVNTTTNMIHWFEEVVEPLHA
ncbi:hypothetical protein JHL18_00555 [Clostridium sp. YIM B02505]|uniref:Phage tail protein n=1 Tax=Clostridium yunnanense TaxID=2800325 RepID=A0ABS1EID3_9CLOT|nr:major tail protein [Clostridium yunnanense]MBK1809139.1 hypothetical protein [Clostridium yunnanense]